MCINVIAKEEYIIMFTANYEILGNGVNFEQEWEAAAELRDHPIKYTTDAFVKEDPNLHRWFIVRIRND